MRPMHRRPRPLAGAAENYYAGARLQSNISTGVGSGVSPPGYVATAFPGPTLRHFQKQGSVKEELMASDRRVQVKFEVDGRASLKMRRFRESALECRNGRTPFASSNLARSAIRSSRER